MVLIYVLNLKEGKFYVGMTTRNIQRVWEHIDGKGAKWTKKYPPLVGDEVESMQNGLELSDENRITIETMHKHGIENVRGGSWCAMDLTYRQIRQISRRIVQLPNLHSPTDVNLFSKGKNNLKSKSSNNRKKNRTKIQRKFRSVLLPMNTPPIKTCRAMKLNGWGRCRKNAQTNWAGKKGDDQLCNMHRGSVKSNSWGTISIEEMGSIPTKFLIGVESKRAD